MEVSLILVMLGSMGSVGPLAVNPPLIVGKFTSIQSCKDAVKDSAFAVNGPMMSEFKNGQYICIQTK